MRLDLDAARAARAAKSEALGEEHTIVLRGQEFTLPPEMPAEFAFQLAEGRLRNSVKVLLGESQFERFTTLQYSVDDLLELTEGVADLYGFNNLGEAWASRRSSSSTGNPSRPTSKRSTAKTSAASSGANGKSDSGGSGP